jgi:phosphoglycerate dehydrogenase-like enzyme
MRSVVVDTTPIRGPAIEALGEGGRIARFGVGVDSVDLARATARGVYVTNTPGVLDDAVVEHTLHLLLSLSRGTPYAGGRDLPYAWRPPGMARELRGRTLAVVGCGQIGRRFGRAAALGLGMRVVGCEPKVAAHADLREHWGFAALATDWDAAVAQADVVSLHLPVTPATRDYVNPARLARLRPDTWLINTARGDLVDEIALHEALASGRLGAAALDVFRCEPYAPADPAHDLRLLPNILMTSHIASSTQAAFDRMAAACLANIRAHASGDIAAMDLVNPDLIRRG